MKIMTTKPISRIRRHQELGGLQDLLLKACPPDAETQRISIPVLAGHLNQSSASIYKWIKQGWLPNDKAMKIIKLSGGKVSRKEFFPFVLPPE